MLTTATFKQAIRNLKNTIKGRAQSSREMRQEANKLSGMAKHRVHLQMREYGNMTRHYLLAYAMIRGIPYRKVERHCRPENCLVNPEVSWGSTSLSADRISSCLINTGLGENTVEALWGPERVKAWVEAPVEETRKAA